MALTDEAIEKIKDMIVSGELEPGQRLPPEKDLGERLGLSRTPLREAVKALAVIGVLDVRHGDGTFVTSLRPAHLLEAISFLTDLHEDRGLSEIWTVIRMLEPATVAMAAERIDDVTLDALAEMLDAVDETASVEDLVVHDLKFHQMIAQATGNNYLASLLDGLANKTLRARVWRSLTDAGSVGKILQEHRSILEALRDKDASLAAALATVHVSEIDRRLRRSLGS